MSSRGSLLSLPSLTQPYWQHLPIEVTWRIVAQLPLYHGWPLKPDKKGLASCSLVCRYWTEYIRPVLFECELYGPSDVDDLFNILASAPVVGPELSTLIQRIIYVKNDNRIPGSSVASSKDDPESRSRSKTVCFDIAGGQPERSRPPRDRLQLHFALLTENCAYVSSLVVGKPRHFPCSFCSCYTPDQPCACVFSDWPSPLLRHVVRRQYITISQASKAIPVGEVWGCDSSSGSRLIWAGRCQF